MTMASTFTTLRYHIVFSTKNRQPLLTPQLIEPMHGYLGGCLRSIGGAPLEIGGIADHVHILTALKPTHRLSDVLCDIKKGSSRWIREEMGCSKFHWQDGYAAFTVGRTEVDRVQRYVAGQAGHHATKSFEDELRELLKAYGIAFDERYLL
jgi:REP element-mobilizing transposase RayT